VKITVVTLVSGRHGHLERQHAGLARSHRRPDDYIVVAMGYPALADWRPDGPPSPCVAQIAVDGALPLAAARNLGARLAIERGADLVVFLDVDCIPHPRLLAAYAEAASAYPQSLLTGRVGYLPEGVDYSDPASFDAAASVHAFRPDPGEGEIERGHHDLFWSLSFASTRDTWLRLGGFFEGYRGYGGEDTDFGLSARDGDVDLVWVGGATAYHQHHETHDPPVHHLDDILANGSLFESRWGFWPMRGWLDGFEQLGLVRRDPAGAYTRIGVPT
jgi:N-acetylglucosaminyl-diphospho-decaprenol L-rhamnosyltransferase